MTSPSSPASPQVRLTVLLVVVACLFAALIARLWFLQVVNAPAAQAAAQNNGVRIIYTPAPRGDILDRNGKVLVGNINEPVIEVDRQTAAQNPAMETRLAALIGMTVKQLQTVVNDNRYSPYAPVPVLVNASPQQILDVQENQSLFPGVQATTQSVRDYSALGVYAANIVGYVGQINAAQYKALKSKGYQPGDQIGETGVEATYDRVLRGTPGIEKVAVDSRGQVLSVLSSTPPVPGLNLRLTIDGNIQKATELALQNGMAAARTQRAPNGAFYKAPSGAVVVENPTNGTIVAMATAPDYNPNQFVGGISQANYAALNNPASNYPLIDRAIAGEYNPGSTFKLVTATAGLKLGIITPTSLFNDNKGGLQVGTQFFSNDGHASYGLVALPKAITVSDDAYFYHIGATIWDGRGTYGPNAFQNVADQYGFASPTGIDLPGESYAYVLTPAEKAKLHALYPKAYPNGLWTTGDNVQSAIGEDDVTVTPIQMANAYSTFANGGTVWTPRVAQDAETSSGKVMITYPSKPARQITYTPADHAAMLAGFTGVANNPQGTAYASFGGANFPITVAGKTGTAQVSAVKPGQPGYKQDTSVFTSFAPANNPQYTVVSFVAQAGYGASVSAPIVANVYRTLFNVTPPGPAGGAGGPAGGAGG
ncbi:MAG: penicillin-binding protein 2 [Acidimicrobiales bacterium]